MDTCYVGKYLLSDPLLKFNDKGIAGFLSILYDFVFDIAQLLSYNDSRKDTLVELVLELRRLPPKPFKIWEVCCVFVLLTIIHPNFLASGIFLCEEPVFAVTIHDRWNGDHGRVLQMPFLYSDEKPMDSLCAAIDRHSDSDCDGDCDYD
jgi:hypothetical protein